ncbi:glycine--tRNA ligase subunit beta [Pelagerythrobacter marinus]|uniref:glycine--tRNA ligase subunit beta n=1 Tax=Pelagerythrobacter marinus TaxID=538382 RepID=UPI0020370E47|nr:glycine--tRNA ligase subunit beta [Pelagerythrobacter marinus]USA40568.1 glycine--tRNA ligase subunit beta [Pelagerythrobacter marinus]WPZ08261.1 glycine--tRNA ligase subunit beta [Pelagerythrobacter marinus]
MADFLLELRCEEIPARMQAGARAELEKLFRREMDAAGVAVGAVTVWSTPRRLALIARDLPQATEAVSEEAKGPPEGAPDQAVEGFCRKNGVTRDQLEVREVKGRPTYFAVRNIPGRATRDLLAEAIPAIVRDFSWPKSMRWGSASISTESLRWVRPLSGIVALLGHEVVECKVHGIKSGRETEGHRFHGIRKPDPKSRNFGLPVEIFKDENLTVLNSNGMIEIGNADDYERKLADVHVIVNHKLREDEIRIGARAAARDAGLTLVEDEGLVIENAGLTEWPVPLLGRFDEDFLAVPPEVIQLTARVNQKYFVCEDADGKLANAFVCTANIEAQDGGARVVDGNRKVLAARLADARFFWDVDRKKTLAEHARGLERITFHEKLGTVAEKVERVAKLARWLVEEGIVRSSPSQADGEDRAALADMAERAARLCKADLVTEMVGEFPELQGLMGGYYARAEGLPDAVADAIRDHYKPVGQGDHVPTAAVTVAVSLADKLDTLRSFFSIDEKPTGSKDPFALRRAALGVIRLVMDNGLRLPIAEGELLDFFADRLKVQQREAGVRHDLIDAVFALGNEDDLVRLLARVNALQAFIETEDGANLLAGYKRAANILKKEDWHGIEGEIAQTGEEDPLAIVDDPDLKAVIDAKMAERHAKELSYTPEPAEKALMAALDGSERKAAAAIEAEDFGAAMAALASLRAPIDRFFDEVTVNADEENKRAHRLDLLARFRAAVHKVADFSRIEG